MDLNNHAGDVLGFWEAENDGDITTAQLVNALSESARGSVTSFAGATFLLMLDGRPITFTALAAGSDMTHIVTSLLIPLDAMADVPPGSMLIIYASRMGALVDLAADAVVALNIAPDSVMLDRHLPAPRELAPASGLADAMLAQQAIGVLISRGRAPEDARIELHRLAWMADTPVGEAAAALIAAAEHSDLGPAPDPDTRA